MSYLKLRSKLFFLSYTAVKERWQLGWSQGDHKTEVGFLGSEAAQEEIEIIWSLAQSDQINIILKADWNPSLNKLKLVILESVCSHHICYCGNNKKLAESETSCRKESKNNFNWKVRKRTWNQKYNLRLLCKYFKKGDGFIASVNSVYSMY